MTKSTSPPLGPHFINVDLEIWSRSDLAVLGAAVEKTALVLYVGKSRGSQLVALEADRTKLSSPESIIWALLDVMKTLPAAARRLWKGADARVFNIGYQAEDFVTVLHQDPANSGRWRAKDPQRAAKVYESSLSPKLLQAVARVEGTITTTIYPPTRMASARRTTAKRR
jgi:hypothetical protein